MYVYVRGGQVGVNSVPSTVSPCSTHCLPVISGPKCVYPTSPVCSVLWLRCAALHGVVCVLRL